MMSIEAKSRGSLRARQRGFLLNPYRFSGGGGGGVGAGWNPADASPNAGVRQALSVSNRRVENIGSSPSAINGFAASTTSGLKYFEVVIDLKVGSAFFVGINGGPTGDLWTDPINTSYLLYRANGQGFRNGGAYVGAGTAPLTGDVVGVSFNFGTRASTVFLNGVAVHTATLAVAAGGFRPVVWFEATPGNRISLRTKSSEFGFPPPSGYSAWEV